MIDHSLISFIATIIATIIGVILGYYFGRRASGRLETKSYTVRNALELLKLGRSEEWNEVRAMNPGWIPDASGAQIHEKDLSGSNFRNVVLKGASLENSILDYCDFSSANLEEANLETVSMHGARLVGANLRKANLTKAKLDFCDFSDANLEDTILKGASLRGASLKRSNLKGADLKESDLEGADLRGASLININVPIQVIDSHEIQVEPDTTVLLNEISKDPTRLDSLTEASFEKIISLLFKNSGFKVISEPVERGIEAYDFIIERLEPFSEQAIVEIKRIGPQKKLGISPIRALQAARLQTGAKKAFLVTTGHIGSEARKIAEELGDIELVDRDTLISWSAKVVSKL